MRLVHPVDHAIDRDPGPEHGVHQVCRGQVLHVLDALLEQPGLVPDVQPIQVAQRVVLLEAGDQAPQGLGGEVLKGLQPELGKYPH
jgi:hypothetical protein